VPAPQNHPGRKERASEGGHYKSKPKSEEKKRDGVGAQEPTLTKLGWGTLKLMEWAT